MAEGLSTAGPGRAAPPEPWSHNLHYHRVILDAVPPGCEQALDVGCGTGALTRRLKRLVPHVTGIDRDERSIQLARAHPGAAGIRYLQADFLAASFEPASLDLVTSVASLHHMDARAALRRMSDLTGSPSLPSVHPGTAQSRLTRPRSAAPGGARRAHEAETARWTSRPRGSG
jgi:SAM-dependent methyltransferase